MSTLETSNATHRRARASSVLGAAAARLIERSRPSVTELALVAVLLLALGAAVFGPHVRDGGFYSDDWATAAEHRAGAGDGVIAALDRARSGGLFAFRPLLALALPVPHALFGLDASLHLALAAVLGALTSVCLYALLRTLGIEPLHAGAIAALTLLFPSSDATRLWATASMNNLAIAFYLLGTTLALRGLEAHGGRARRLHAGAVALYVSSVLTYEVTAVAILASVLVYAARSSWRAALLRWPWDVLAVGAVLAGVTSNTQRELRSPDELLARVQTVAGEGVAVLGAAALPVRGVTSWAVPAALAAVVGAALLVIRRLPRGDAVRFDLVRWLALALAAALVIVAGYAIFVPGEDHYSPLKDGLSNRVNVLAALGHVTLVYAVIVLAATLAARWAPPSSARLLAVALPALAAVGLAFAYAGQVRDHQAGYARTTAFQGRLLGLIEREVRAPRGATLYTFGHPTYTAPGVAAFRHWDLKGAARIVLADPSLDAYPIYPGIEMVCEGAVMYPRSRFYSREQSLSPYGKGVWVDFAGRRSVIVRDRAQCLRLRSVFRPGTWS